MIPEHAQRSQISAAAAKVAASGLCVIALTQKGTPTEPDVMGHTVLK